MNSFVEGIEFVVKDCASCHVQYAITNDMDERLRNNGKTFYCPNGHSLWYGKSEAKRLKVALDQERRNIEYWKGSAETASNSLRATKGVVTKLKKRIAAGKCPCCEVHFEDLKNHIEEEHPEYQIVEKEPVSN